MTTVESHVAEQVHRVPLHRYYEGLLVPLVDYEGWLLPQKFQEIRDEVALLENGTAFVDFADHGILRMEGRDAIDLLHRISTNDLRNFQQGNAIQTALLSEKGRVIDSVLVFHRGDHLLVMTSRAAEGRVAQWIERFIIMEDVTLSDETGRHLLFTHCNSHSGDLVSAVGVTDDSIFRTAYFDVEGTFYVGAVDSGTWDAVRVSHLVQVGNEAYEVFRIRHGFPSYGKEITTESNPLELNLRTQVNFTKGCYVGQEVIARLDTYKKVQRKLCRVRVIGTLRSQERYRIIFEGEEVGRLTSHILDPKEDSGSIGLALVKSTLADVGARYLLDDDASSVTIEALWDSAL
jgi:folate-binding protein YgfZ